MRFKTIMRFQTISNTNVMKLKCHKTATACGLFASGLIAGYTASRVAGPLKEHLSSVKQSAGSLSGYKITPTIPEFDGTDPMDDLGLDLAMNE